MSQGGFALQIPRPELFYQLLTRCRACRAELTADTSADSLSATELHRAMALQDALNQILESAHAAACARVLLMAADILHSPSPQAAGDRLATLRHNEPSLEPWLDSLGRKRHTVPSDGLLQAIARLPRRFGIPRIGPHTQLGSRHIPQLLPVVWWPEAEPHCALHHTS